MEGEEVPVATRAIKDPAWAAVLGSHGLSSGCCNGKCSDGRNGHNYGCSSSGARAVDFDAFRTEFDFVVF